MRVFVAISNHICLFLLSIVIAMMPISLLAAVLEEVIVTAQKREQSLQDVNIALSVISEERLVEGFIGDIEDLQTLLPNVSAGNDFGQAKFFFRGLGLSSSFTAVDPSVALYVDGAIITRAEGQLGAFFDLDRIEALRGPQGTLYGRNATGGSLNLISKKPTEELEGYARATWGSYDLLQFEGAVGGPLSDMFLGRIAFKSTDRDGFAKNEFSGRDVDDSNRQSVRGQLQFNFNEDMDFLLSAEYSNEDDAGLALSFVRETFAPPTFIPGTGGFPTGRRNVATDSEPVNDRDTWSLTGTLNWRITDNWTVRSVTNYRELDVGLGWENDSSAIVTDDNIFLHFKSEAISQELQLLFDNDRFLSGSDGIRGLVGVYYIKEDLAHDQIGGCNNPKNDLLNPACQANGSVPRVMEVIGSQDIEAVAIFANVSYDVTDQITLNAGARYSYEERSVRNAVFFNFPDFNFVTFTVGSSFANPLRLRDSFNDFSPSVGLEWRPKAQPLEDTLFYFTYSEAFKSGAVLSGFGTNFVEPEEIENYEFGMKTEFFDNRLRINVAGFFYDAKNLQFDTTIANPNQTFSQRFTNAASQSAKGIEVDAIWVVTDQLRLSGSGGWLDAEFDNFVTSNTNVVLGQTILEDLAGNRPRQSPKWSGNLRGEYDFNLNNGGVITLGAEASYKSTQFFTEFEDVRLRQDAYSLVDANIKYTSPGKQFTINIWGKNLTDEFVRSGMFPSGGGRVISEALLPPATGGITVGYNF